MAEPFVGKMGACALNSAAMGGGYSGRFAAIDKPQRRSARRVPNIGK
jgi:hypothetical protein